MKIENVRKCVKCNKTFIGNNNCPYCGSRKIIETDEFGFLKKDSNVSENFYNENKNTIKKESNKLTQ